MQEIERKFLVASREGFEREVSRSTRIVQGYLNSDPDRTVRIRIRGEQGFLTIKGKSDGMGLSRFEWEQEIPRKEAEILLGLCEPGRIEKIRHEVSVGSHTFEVDEFLGQNGGLLLAELEVVTERESFPRPQWLGREVTGDKKYYNSYLSKCPYKNW